MKSAIVKPERPGGFLDLMPAEYLAREKMIRTVETVFRSYGFDSIETPVIEFAKTLEGETSDTGKNIFHVRSEQEDEPLAMRFDHTVPFARLLAANPHDPKKRQGIRLPWRRMVCGPVFRGEKPQSGRYRQFLQFDMDIAGTADMLADLAANKVPRPPDFLWPAWQAHVYSHYFSPYIITDILRDYRYPPEALEDWSLTDALARANTAKPIRACSMSVKRWSNAPVGQAGTQGMSSHISQAARRAVKYGVPIATASPAWASFKMS